MGNTENTCFTLQEEFCGETAAAARDQLLDYIEQEKTSLSLDFSQVKTMDSIGLGVLVTLQKRAAVFGGGIILEKMPEEIYHLFRRTRLLTAFNIV